MRRESIRQRLALIVVVAVGVGLLFSFLMFGVRDAAQRREAKLTELVSMAQVIAFNASAVVEFGDRLGAERLFGSLEAHPDVLSAQMLGKETGFLYEYVKPGEKRSIQTATHMQHDHSQPEHFSDWRQLTVAVPIRTADGVIGSVELTATLANIWRDMAISLAIFMAGSIIAFLLAFGIARRMQLPVLAALGALGDTAARVAHSKDYSQRAIKQADDEIGDLADAFNTMMSEIAQRDQALQAQRDHLEETVEQRTQALSIAKEAAEAANRAKSTFLANMSHELRTPMNAIMGMTSLAQRRATDPKLRDQLVKIDLASRHLLAVINDILDISKIEADRLTLEQIEFRLVESVENLMNLIGHKARDKGLALHVDLPREIATLSLRGDPLRLGQILLNLVSNAIKFTPAGTITLRVRCVSEHPERVVMRFEVQDTGIGMSAAEQQRLFTAFEQADTSMTRKYGGTGLGLAISKRLVHLMGGDIDVDSQPYVGSTFWFTACFDKADRAVSPAPTFASQQAEEQLKRRAAGMRVLLAEDEPINQEVALELLEDAGFMVDLAEDGEAAVTLAQSEKYDLILLDMQMPKLNGVVAARQIRALPAYAHTPILAVTANAFSEDRELCLSAGMNDHIAKPVDSAVMYQTLLKWLPPART
jgi:signal transduction histidine kinase/ActR/RegA family two-component response regulator